ncbi:VanW family protein [Desulfotomaculum copahuensis]|uniref:G5 domain-containing protein n=1 Tax=Desulfotomaculum copahuensis TaxID=1838280 RepID=A0A1B7LEB2_9FIRM|nr:VanW family protein [Desulfotomaculum copahuensis]OAT81442.1 hypothetical protein A6M21_11295 [Desulfotomaculum copahuensis]
MKAVSRRPFRWLAAGLLAGALLVLGFAYAYAARGQERVLEGVQLPGVNLQGLTREQGMQALSAFENRITGSSVRMIYRKRDWQLAPQKIDLRLDKNAIMDAALKAGRDVPWWERWARRRQIVRDGFDVPLVFYLNRDKFYGQLDALGKELTGTPPRDAAFRVRADDSIEIIPGRAGMEIDKKRACQDLMAALRAGRPPEINLSLVRVPPRVDTGTVEAMGLKGLLASFSTRFDSSYTERAYNIKVAAAALDGLLVPPGQEVSFNKVVGPRSTEAGYKNAKVIVNNKLVDGPGGGVCQVSTTLYNTVLLANLQILDRTNHSLPVAYVPMGRDATVSYGYIDFRFRNDTESYIYLRSIVNGGEITFKIYGNTAYRVPVEIHTDVTSVQEPGVLREPDPALKKGEQVVKQKGARGYTVAAERITWENGRRRVETLPVSKYDPVREIVAVGTAQPSSNPVVPPPPKQQPPPGSGRDNGPGGTTAHPDGGTQQGQGTSGNAGGTPPGQPPGGAGEKPPGQATPDGSGGASTGRPGDDAVVPGQVYGR